MSTSHYGAYDYCLATAATTIPQCYSLSSEVYFIGYRELAKFCPAQKMEVRKLNSHYTTKTLHEVWHIFWTISPTVFTFAVARIVAQLSSRIVHDASVFRFALEFILIIIPAVVSVNVANGYVFYFVVTMMLCLLGFTWYTNCVYRARERKFQFGNRPCILTLARSTISLLTALCILAIDFGSFPKEFRKSRTYGASLMDVGIGLFVYSMATVSRRPRRSTDLIRLVRTVAPLLFLGLTRTIVIMAINYHQDEHEYGMHLNAFFTLGLTKLFGTLLCAVATSEVHILYLGGGVVLLHEFALQLGIGDFVMDPSIERNTFWSANREGLCSLPGFVSLYLFSMYIGQWLQDKETLTFKEFKGKLRSTAIFSVALWKLTIASIYVVGIVRVTCNFGYTVWILAIALTMTLLFMIVFDLILNTIWPVNAPASINDDMGGETLLSTDTTTVNNSLRIPAIVDALNLNGLTFFLVANVLTGGVNIYLEPERRTDAESVFILTIYMLIATGFIFILYRYKLRVA